MSKSLKIKLVFLMLLLIIVLMTVVGVFLIRGVQNYYTDIFYDRMEEVFGNEGFSSSVNSAAQAEDAPEKLKEVLGAYAGSLGIGSGERVFYILDKETAHVLASSEDDAGPVNITPNIASAMNGEQGKRAASADGFMDMAVPVNGGTGSYIIYILDSKQTVRELDRELIIIILEAVLLGCVFAAVLSLIIVKTMLEPIQGMTRAAEEMAGGDFSRKIEVQSEDELGILAETFNDMASQLEATLEEIRRSESMRREFVADVSHELRTPITSIKSYSETLAENPDIPDDMKTEFLRVIVNESDRMTKIVQDLLELSRFDSGASKLSIEEFDIEKSIRDVYAAILIEARKRGHDMELELEWQLPHIRGDRARIEQVIMNIVMNAVKYTPDGGRIDITAGAVGPDVYIKVSDNGTGIPKEDLPRLFDRFYRVDKARSRESGGTGLGLAIAKEIISMHGGDIMVESEVGEGTTFTIKLPIDGAGSDE